MTTVTVAVAGAGGDPTSTATAGSGDAASASMYLVDMRCLPGAEGGALLTSSASNHNATSNNSDAIDGDYRGGLTFCGVMSLPLLQVAVPRPPLVAAVQAAITASGSGGGSTGDGAVSAMAPVLAQLSWQCVSFTAQIPTAASAPALAFLVARWSALPPIVPSQLLAAPQ